MSMPTTVPCQNGNPDPWYDYRQTGWDEGRDRYPSALIIYRDCRLNKFTMKLRLADEIDLIKKRPAPAFLLGTALFAGRSGYSRRQGELDSL